MARLRPPEPPPRLVDWTVLGLVTVALATGLVSLVTGRPEGRTVFVVHGVSGFALVVALCWKLRRVWRRLASPRRWNATVVGSVLALLAIVATLATGVLWASGGDFTLVVWNALTVHALLGVLAVPLVLFHLSRRFRLPRRTDFDGRRTALSAVVLAAFGGLAWLVQGAFNRSLRTEGADRRFTGSRERGSLEGNAFPTTSWVADDPEPIDASEWALRVDGAVTAPRSFAPADLARLPTAEDRATLDCTGGWYSEQDWTGVRVGDLLDAAGATADARHVRFVSVTGYRVTLPLDEARDALLATHVGGERLSHGHGFPIRLVAPGRRGFQWVKWVAAVEPRSGRDPGQWLAIFTSGFD